jgi:hypothetical protein
MIKLLIDYSLYAQSCSSCLLLAVFSQFILNKLTASKLLGRIFMLESHQINRCDKIIVAAFSMYKYQASFGHIIVQSQFHGELACQ